MLEAAAGASPLVRGLRCRECGREYRIEPVHVCEHCFGPLEVAYAYDQIARRISREIISRRAPNLWRYRELLPLAELPTVGLEAGFTPLVAAPHLGRRSTVVTQSRCIVCRSPRMSSAARNCRSPG